MARLYATVELGPTHSIVTSLGSQTISCEAISRKKSELINDCHLPYFLAVLTTQDQIEKSKYALQTNHKRWLAFSWLASSFLVPTTSNQNIPGAFPVITVKAPLSCACDKREVSAKYRWLVWLPCYSKLWMNSFSLFSRGVVFVYFHTQQLWKLVSIS